VEPRAWNHSPTPTTTQDGSHGYGRSLITDALSLVADGEPVFAAGSPGNARSLRALIRQLRVLQGAAQPPGSRPDPDAGRWWRMDA